MADSAESAGALDDVALFNFNGENFDFDDIPDTAIASVPMEGSPRPLEESGRGPNFDPATFSFDGLQGDADLLASDLLAKMPLPKGFGAVLDDEPCEPRVPSGASGQVSKRRSALLLVLLVHASTCRKRHCDFCKCAEGRRLLEHIRTCTQPSGCGVHLCALGTSLLAHFRRCRPKSSCRAGICSRALRLISAVKRKKRRESCDIVPSRSPKRRRKRGKKRAAGAKAKNAQKQGQNAKGRKAGRPSLKIVLKRSGGSKKATPKRKGAAQSGGRSSTKRKRR
jgi:hypothetical protein